MKFPLLYLRMFVDLVNFGRLLDRVALGKEPNVIVLFHDRKEICQECRLKTTKGGKLNQSQYPADFTFVASTFYLYMFLKL